MTTMAVEAAGQAEAGPVATRQSGAVAAGTSRGAVSIKTGRQDTTRGTLSTEGREAVDQRLLACVPTVATARSTSFACRRKAVTDGRSVALVGNTSGPTANYLTTTRADSAIETFASIAPAYTYYEDATAWTNQD